MTEINHFPFSITEDDHFSVIEKYFVENGPVRHQFESYEYMVHHTIQKIFDECTSIEISTKTTIYKATFGQVYFEKASIIDENRQIKHITPHEARIRDITYDSPIFVDIKEEFWEKKEDGQEEKVNIVNHAKVFLLRLPTMVRSSRCNLYGKSADECIKLGECENDPGGYFLVNGKERALIYQERLNYNQTYCFESNSDKYPFVVEIRSMSEETCHSILLKATLDKDCRNCCFSLPYMSKEVCAGSVFKALGFNNEEIIQFINPSSPEENKLVERLIRESIMYTTKEKALKYISKSSIQKVEDNEERRIHYTIQVLENELFPHMGISTNLEKGLLLGTMINKLFRVSLGKRKHDDRDNVSIKRIEGPGVLLGDLFRMCLKRYCDNLKKYLEKRQDIITAISRTNSITAAIRNPMATGNWCAQKNTYVRTGVSQIMSRLSYPATISHLRRIVIPIGKEGKNVKIRQIHPTQCFFIDTIESPEGKGIGIIKNFALMSKVTVGCNSILVRKMVEQSSFIYLTSQFFEMKDNRQCSMIYLNGTLIGITDKIDECYDELYKMKYEQNLFSNQVSFFKDKDDHELRIFCDHGRFTRPLLKVNNNKDNNKDNNLELGLTKEHLSHTWNELIENDIIQYVDSNEVEQSLIAMYPSDLVEYSNQPYNYCEIHPSTMLGVCSSVIPYGEHNQNPRLVYEASMMKQALGMYALSHKGRFDTISHVMHYPQKPLVETKYNSILHYDEMLTGINPIVAIACYTGFNQEDSVTLNKASVDRGMCVTTAYRTISFEEKKKTNCSFEKIEIPPLKSQKKELNYSKLGPNGIVKKGLPVYKGDVVVGKTLTKVQKDEQEEKMDCSLSISIGEEGIIDEIWTGPSEEGFFMVKIKIRQMRIPEVGDKLASRSSQKGVCGLLLEQENMPFTSEGITPDLLMNPHSQPSRMTLSQLIECLYSKVGSLNGTFGDSTAFTKQSINPVEDIANMLKRHGFQKYGNERLYSGFTGELLDSELFIGPTYYQRLKHLVADKIHCLTTDHEVLTLDEGWKPIANITLTDEIATLTPNDELCYQRPTHVYNYPDYNGSLYSVESSLVSLTVTQKHRMWVKQTGDHFFEFKTPEQMLGKHYIYKKDAKWNNKPLELPLQFDSMGEILLSTARFPDWVMFLSVEQTRELIDSTFLDQECYYTTQIIADQIQQLCLHAGWTCLIKSQKNTVSFEIKKTNMNYYEPYHEKFYKQENIKGCRVICLTVPNEIFYVRRNGKAVWTGNSRATGNVTMMHHQPSEGRSREGGLRVGEMERDALISHGGAAFIQETLFDMSDQYQVNVCEQCGNILSSMTACRICKIGQVNRTNIPYCAKLLFQELEAMGIKIQIHTK